VLVSFDFVSSSRYKLKPGCTLKISRVVVMFIYYFSIPFDFITFFIKQNSYEFFLYLFFLLLLLILTNARRVLSL
jgi:hypothetical protein